LRPAYLRTMQKTGDRLLFSASDLVGFLECEHLTTLDLLNLESPLPAAPEDEQLELIQQKGLDHERAYLNGCAQAAGTSSTSAMRATG